MTYQQELEAAHARIAELAAENARLVEEHARLRDDTSVVARRLQHAIPAWAVAIAAVGTAALFLGVLAHFAG